MNFILTAMAYGDVRLVSFIWSKWLLPGDSLIGTPVIAAVEPIASATLVGVNGSTVTCVVTAGIFTGTGQVSCEVETADGEKATRTVGIAVAPTVTNAI